ncbi:MAG TPA: YihY/virulence factor BrkB family protein [Candidatus Gastranaerophilales bacterium]|nr:YihY/virulence factor BrkB family protein [Candidatus Gastranaerophilales bacterium]
MSFLNSFQNVVKSTIKDDCFGMAAGMAFNFILALFPFLMLLTAIFGIIGTEQMVEQIIISIKSVVPNEALYLIQHTLLETLNSSPKGILTISVLTGFLFASNSINALRKLLNNAYSVPETRSTWKIWGITLWVIILFILALFVITNLIIMGKVLLNFLDNYIIGVPDSLIAAINVARWPVTFLMLFLTGFIIYYFLPNISVNIKNRIMSSLPGTLFFTLVWLAMSRLFGLYVENFAQLNKVYGTLGAVVILLLWLYYTALIILIGGEVNSEVYKRIKTKEN